MTVSISSPTRTLSTALGVVSLTLGASEVLAPAAVAGMAGVPATRPTRRVIRLLGVRECGHGAAILLGSPRFVWTRVVGDALDVALLVQALRRRGANRRRGAIALGVLTVIGAADAVATAGALNPHLAMMQTRFPFNWLLNTNSVLAQWFCHADVDDSVQAQRDGRSGDGT